MIKVVVIILTVWNTSNGDKLYEITREFDGLSVSGNRIEECRRFGVREAYRLTDTYRATNPDTSTNVDCHWEERAGAPA